MRGSRGQTSIEYLLAVAVLVLGIIATLYARPFRNALRTAERAMRVRMAIDHIPTAHDLAAIHPPRRTP